jgi:hypothetical protein
LLPALRQLAIVPVSVMPLWLGHGLPDFGTAVGAFIDEVDRRKAPMRLDVSDEHRKQSNAAGADDRGHLNDRVMLDVGWHVALLRTPK